MPHFELYQTCKTTSARRGELRTQHGTIQTPVFMPVATVGAIKGLEGSDLMDMGAEIILNNTYHMAIRPGLESIQKFGGLHRFIGWDKPILTDSGGFQVFSLAKTRKITEEGVHFKSHLDGAAIYFTPESTTAMQEAFGSDIHMVLDVCCPYPCEEGTSQAYMEQTHRWAQRAKNSKTNSELLQFGIVQGSFYPGQRQESCATIAELEFEGNAIGGLSVGEPKPIMREMTALCCAHLPEDKPRYLMGVGTPLDLVESIALGVDMFDCVLPARNARRGTLYTSVGKKIIKNAQHKDADEPLDPNCHCATCQTYSTGFLRHLFSQNETTSYRLLTRHNLHYFLKLMQTARSHIEAGTYPSFLKHHQALWEP